MGNSVTSGIFTVSQPFNQVGPSQKHVNVEKLPERHYVAVLQVSDGDIVFRHIL